MSFHETSTRWIAIGIANFFGVWGCSADAGFKGTNNKPTGTAGSTVGGAGGSSSTGGSGGSGASTGSGGTSVISTPTDAGPGATCQNLQCYQNTCRVGACKVGACSNGGTTTISGSIYDPAGAVPLYNIIVYVPNTALDPIGTGASCERCGSVSGSPITSTITDAKGQFKLENVPATTEFPLVIQVGKWRREVKIPPLMSCTDTPLTDKNVTRLPRTQSEGHLPKIALTTGNADALECLLRKIGIADAEFTPEAGMGRVNFFFGDRGTPKYNASMNGGAAFTPAPTFWSNADTLKGYDIVLLSCEGTENPTNKTVAARQAMQDYANAGGRVFASHWHNYWLEFGPAPFPTVATFNHQSDLSNPFTADIDQTFPKGKALAEWLVNVGSAAPLGRLIINEGKRTVTAANAAVAQRWVYSTSPASTQYLTVNTPVGAAEDKVCGRIVFSDIHVSSGDTSTATTAYPDGCTTSGLSDQEKALEFMLFDLSSCVTGDTKPPMPPK